MVPGVTRTVDNIIKESVLIDVFRQSHLTLEKNLVLNHLTTHHTDPDMTETFRALHRHMAAETASPHQYTAGRTSKYKIPDFIDKGAAALTTSGTMGGVQEADKGIEDEQLDVTPDIEDISVDLTL